METAPSLAIAGAFQIALKAKAEPPAGWPMPGLAESAREFIGESVTLVHADAVPVCWTRWDNVKAIDGRRSSGTWRDLVTFLAAMSGATAPSKAACSGWAPCDFTNSRRADSNTIAIHAITLDCDDRGDWDLTLAELRELAIAFCAHRSPSHGVDGSVKWRLIVPLAAPVTQIDRWRGMYSAARAAFGALGAAWYDPTCSNPSRLWYPPITVGDSDRREVIESEGMALDLVRLTALVEGAAAVVGPSVLPPKKRLSVVRSARDRAERWIEKVEGAVEGQGGDDATFRVAAKLVRDFSLSDSEALGVLNGWNARCSPPWSQDELEAKITRARKYGTHADGEALNDVPVEVPRGVAAVIAARTSPIAAPAPVAPAARPRGVQWIRVHPDSSPRAGKPISCVENLESMLAHYNVTARFCLMSHRASIEVAGQVVAAERRNNSARAQIREWARLNQYQTGAPFEDQLELIISKRWSHPVADWIRSVPWDGVDRIQSLFESLTLNEEWADKEVRPAEYGRLAVTRRDLALRMLTGWAITAAKAACLPAGAREGVAAQGVLVLQGPGGCGKSRWFQALGPPDKALWVKESCILDPSNRDSLQAATKAWICEIGELDGTFRKSDIAALKAFLTSRVDTYRKAYDASDEDVARRTVFAASVNDAVFLVDDTGNRRFWGMQVIACNAEHGIALQQLWAQADHLARTQPERGWLDADEAACLASSNETFESVDPLWESLCRAWGKADKDNPGAWVSLDEIKAGVDAYRQWSTVDSRHLAKLVKGRLAVETRKSKGYSQYRMVRHGAIS